MHLQYRYLKKLQLDLKIWLWHSLTLTSWPKAEAYDFLIEAFLSLSPDKKALISFPTGKANLKILKPCGWWNKEMYKCTNYPISMEYKHKEFYNIQNKTKIKSWMLSYISSGPSIYLHEVLDLTDSDGPVTPLDWNIPPTTDKTKYRYS